ncbi:BatD family protein [Sulfurovum riftiae]|uniref:BatD protein n=1 Tax=Sulfurovum riftiae TaxID=1630136 RepID=A0A151CGU6_9BACT|nr:BatD family protein [Sulfurovum riftiae]KYJ86758.1 hypothetical protein AS592_07985 [Sulfurovum riftiae]
MQSKTVFLFLFLTMMLFGVEGRMRVYLQPHETLYTSQKATVAVELLTDAFSITDARITFPSSSKYIVNAPKSAAYIQKEEIEDNDWQVVHYEYEVYALQAGELEIGAVKAAFSASMGYGQPKKEFVLESEPLHFSVLSPKGIKKEQFVLVTDNYSMTQKINPKKSELIVGDAIEVEVTQKAHGVPDILLKPIHYKSTSELRVYEKEPELQSGLKGKFDVSRTDRFTFVATAEGNVSIPEQRSVWWDSISEKVTVETIPAMHFTVIADPQITLDEKQKKQKMVLIYVTVSVLFLFLFYKAVSPSLIRHWNRRRIAYAKSEKGRYEKLLKSVEKENTAAIYRDLYVWLEVAAGDTKIESFKDIYEKYPQFKEGLSMFEERLVSPEVLDRRYFISILDALRETLIHSTQKDRSDLIDRLNP